MQSYNILSHYGLTTGGSEARNGIFNFMALTVRQKKLQFKEMALFFNNTCVRCEGASGLANVERDHIIPSYQGGKDNVTNYQPLCARCNASKGPETTDHRILYAQKHNITIPKKWLPKRK